MVIKTYKRVFFRHWLDTFRYWNNWCFFLTDTCDTLNDRCLIGTYWTLWVKCLLVGHLQCIRHSTFQMLCTCRTLRLKKCYFVWHLKRFGVLLGWTCTSLRQICAFGLDTCKSFGPKGSLLVQLILYHKFNCLFYTVLLLKHTVFVYNVAGHSFVYFSWICDNFFIYSLVPHRRKPKANLKFLATGHQAEIFLFSVNNARLIPIGRFTLLWRKSHQSRIYWLLYACFWNYLCFDISIN